MTERWLPVVGYEGCYEVSDLGSVRSITRMLRNRRLLIGRILKTNRDRWGYHNVRLSRDNSVRTITVHILVARAFLGPCPDGQMVLHGPAGNQDNSVPNLSYGTALQNAADTHRDGTVRTGSRNHNTKLTEEIIRECRIRAAAGETYAALAREFGCSAVNMNLAVRGVRWRWVPGAVPLRRQSPKER